MKLFCALAFFAAGIQAGANPQLKQVNAVYILGMAGGMDQFLANQLTSLGVFQVVTDPQKADAILTDRVGEPFESKFKELYPPPPPPPPPAPPVVVKSDKDDKDVKSDKPKDDKAKDEKAKDDKDKDAEHVSGAGRVGSMGRGRGNFFIVDRKSKNVIWSVYERPKDSSPGELSKTAERVVKRLKNDLVDKKQGE